MLEFLLKRALDILHDEGAIHDYKIVTVKEVYITVAGTSERTLRLHDNEVKNMLNNVLQDISDIIQQSF